MSCSRVRTGSDRSVFFMKLRAFALAFILASVSLTALAQDKDSQQTPQAPATPQTQPADQTQAQPATPDQTAPDTAQPQDTDKDKDKTGAKDPKVKHDGGKNDVDSIGNRKVGGLDWYSIETDIKIGKTYAQQFEASTKMIQDPVVVEYVNRIGQNLVRNSDAKVPFTIKVVDSDEVNAMALPGGFFYVNSGLI